MDEDQVKDLIERWLKDQGFQVRREVGVPGTEREVILDHYAYRDHDGEPEILWIECKGDQNLSELLEGFIRLELGVHYGGGSGMLAVPHEATQKLFNHKPFLQQAENVIFLHDVETGITYQLKP